MLSWGELGTAMLDFLQTIVGGIAAGSTYALMGLAMVIVYKTSAVPNFAQGEMALASSFFTYMLLEQYGVSYYVAFPATFVFAVVLGCVLEFGVLRRAKDPTILGMIAITIGLEMILLGLVSWKFGADPKTMPFPVNPYDSYLIGGVFVGKLELLTFLAALSIMFVLFLFFRFSKMGIAMKATQQNPNAAKVAGVRTDRITMFAWGISSVVGSLAGC